MRKENSMQILLYSQIFTFEFKYKGCYLSTGLAVHSRRVACAEPLCKIKNFMCYIYIYIYIVSH